MKTNKHILKGTLFLAFIFCFSYSALQAQNQNSMHRSDMMQNQMNNQMIKGKVVNAQTNQAVANAKITIMSSGKMHQMHERMNSNNNSMNNSNNRMNDDNNGMRKDTTVTTDRNGEFTLKNIQGGNHTIKVNSSGYADWQNKVMISHMDHADHNKMMHKNKWQKNKHRGNRMENDSTDNSTYGNKNGYQNINRTNKQRYNNQSNNDNAYTKSLYLTIKLQKNNR